MSTPLPPANRREAARRNLEAIDRTLERVRDAVEREALREERQRMETELERGDLVARGGLDRLEAAGPRGQVEHGHLRRPGSGRRR